MVPMLSTPFNVSVVPEISHSTSRGALFRLFSGTRIRRFPAVLQREVMLRVPSTKVPFGSKRPFDCTSPSRAKVKRIRPLLQVPTRGEGIANTNHQMANPREPIRAAKIRNPNPGPAPEGRPAALWPHRMQTSTARAVA